MRIPKTTIDAIYAAADIVEVVGDYVQLKKKGANYWGLSPFKNERTPSFAVSPQKGIFKDFSSGKGGNAVTFLMEVEGYTYTEALLHIAKKYGIQVQMDESQPDAEEDKLRPSLYALNNFARDYFSTQLTQYDEGRRVGLSYFHERGINDASIAQFQLGYSPEQWDALTQAALQAQYQREYLLQTGLSILKEAEGNQPERIYDRFRGRVIFPIHDVAGRVAGFGGRVMRSDAKAAKYVNSPESPIYSKSNILYGLYFARQAVREAGECILVEGYTDVISLHQAGVKNVVSSSGTSLTIGQINLIKRYAKQILVIYDGDAAGVLAALRGIDLILEQGLRVRAVMLPGQHDPDSFVREQGGAAFRKYLQDHAQDFFTFKHHILLQLNPDPGPARQAVLVNELAATLARIADPLERQAYVRTAAEQFRLPEQLFLSTVNKLVLQHRNQVAARTQPDESQAATPDAAEQALVAYADTIETYHQERELLRLLLNYAEHTVELEGSTTALHVYLQTEIEGIPFAAPYFEQIRMQVVDAVMSQQPIPVHDLLTHPRPEVQQLVAELLTIPYTLSDNWLAREIVVPPLDANLAQALDNALLHFKRKRVAQLIRENQALIQDEKDEAKLTALLQRHRKLDELNRRVAEQLGIIVQR